MTARPVLVVLAAGQGRRFGGLKQLGAVGPTGEAVMDYTIHHALIAAFERVVVVVRPDIESDVRAHLDSRWAESLPVDYALQQPPQRGTAPAVLRARALVGDAPFAVVNADDLYGRETLRLLYKRLAASDDRHVLIGFRLIDTILPNSGPVNRALCRRRPDGTLDQLHEATIAPSPHGGFTATPASGATAHPVGPDDLVSMNAWGFRPEFWSPLAAAVTAAAGDDYQLLLPAVVAAQLAGAAGASRQLAVEVVPVDDRCLSITWPGDLATVQGEVRSLIGAGRLPDRIG